MPIEWLNRWITRIIDALKNGDRDKMVARNVSAELIDSIISRFTVYLHTAAKRENAEKAESDLAQALGEAQSELWDFVELVERTMRYGYRNDSDEMRNIEEISRGGGVDDAINDLRRYHEIIDRKPEQLTAINEDAAVFATTLWDSHENLSTLKAQSDNAPDMSNEEMELMHRGYTYLMEAVDEVVDCAEFLYGRGSEEFDPYIPEYYRELGRKSAKAKASSSTL